ncbi:hypothetical protein DFP73DRAFT_545407 [Morchella snyderi]|nr:hypothetical protein DFP73DRAFT_545407 [Morchella snyderi]
MRLLHSTLLLSGLLAVNGAAVAVPHEAGIDARSNCSPQYRNTPQIYEFDGISVCPRGCIPFKILNFGSRRGLGRIYYGGDNAAEPLTKPILFGNAYAWGIVNCETVEAPLNGGCGNSTKALYNAGGTESRRPRIGTTEYPGTYAVFAPKSFKIWTPDAVANCKQKGCEINLVGIKTNGQKVSYKQNLVADGSRTDVTGLTAKGFSQLTALDVWVTSKKANNSTGLPFTIDSFAFDQMVDSAACPSPTTSTTTGIKGPCTPRPTATSTFTVNLDDFVFQTTTFIGPTEVPTTTGIYAPTPIPDTKPYKSLYWDTAFAVSTKNSGSTELHPELSGVTIPSGGNFLFVRGTGGPKALIKANSYAERFGVKSLWVLCGFPTDGDNLGKKCVVTFYGFRDPYDGMGYPEQVKATVEIDVPGAGGNKFIHVDLSTITTSPGAFRRLSYFFMTAAVGNDNFRPYFLDTIVFTRELGEGTSCRVRGSEVINFDRYTVTTAPLPFPSSDKFILSDNWSITGRSLYAANSPGWIASTSPNNAAHALGLASVDTYVGPVPPIPLVDIESFDITVDATEAQLPRVVLEISVTDSCGQSFGDNVAGFYNRKLTPGSRQYSFAAPIKAVSAITIAAYDYGESGNDRIEVGFWVDNVTGRKSTEGLRGCINCGVRGLGWCEFEALVRVGETK